MKSKKTTALLVIATCIFGYLGIQSIYSMAISLLTPSFFPETPSEVYFDIVSNLIAIAVSVFVVIGIWRRYAWTKIFIAMYTLIVAVEIFCFPIFISSIEYDADYLMAMTIFVGPIILFNIFFLKSKRVEEYFKQLSVPDKAPESQGSDAPL